MGSPYTYSGNWDWSWNGDWNMNMNNNMMSWNMNWNRNMPSMQEGYRFNYGKRSADAEPKALAAPEPEADAYYRLLLQQLQQRVQRTVLSQWRREATENVVMCFKTLSINDCVA